jgi:hypothetical protein
VPKLTIIYKGRTIFDDDVREMDWKESDSSIVVKARTGDAPSGGGGSGLADIIGKALQQKKAQHAAAQPVSRPADEPSGASDPVVVTDSNGVVLLDEVTEAV